MLAAGAPKGKMKKNGAPQARPKGKGGNGGAPQARPHFSAPQAPKKMGFHAFSARRRWDFFKGGVFEKVYFLGHPPRILK